MKKFIGLICIMTLWLQYGAAQSLPSVSILGDSYSTYEGFLQPDTNFVWYWKIPDKEHTDVSSVRETWWHKFISENGYRLCVNNSFSGATICNTGYNGDDYSDRSFMTRLKYLGSPDIIFVFGGTNDCWAKSPIGEYKYEGWTTEELYTFRPAMACLLEGLKDYYPNVKIYFLLNSDLTDEINESVKTVCQHYEIDYIELKEIDKMSGHPSVKGMEQIKEQIEKFMGLN